MPTKGRPLSQLVVRLADYPKIKDIGKGAFGALYSARDPRSGGMVAVKILKNDLSDPREREMFEREVKILAEVDHPTLLAFRGFVPVGAQGGDPPAILTELMTKGSLQGIIDAEKKSEAPADWDETRKFIALYGTAVGMMVLHEHRIIHRDLKPDNILLDDNYEPKVADFGLSKFVAAGATIMQTTRGGTLPYMAPEIYEGSEYDWAVDVYAYGILVYAVVAGMAPYEGMRITSGMQLGIEVTKGVRPTIPSWVDANWKELITSCWNGASAQRPSFEQIVIEMGKPDFIAPGVDRTRFLNYQKRVVPANLHCKFSGPAMPPRPAAAPKSPLQRLIEAAEGGDPDSQHRYAVRLRDGEGVPQDLQKAARFFKSAADRGNAEAQIQYGMALEVGRGVPENLTEAARYYKMACDKGSAFGLFCYADMLEFGKGVKKDEALAARLYKKAADLGHDISQTRYGLILEMGKYGINKDFKEAVRYYKMASDQGSPEGMFNFADMLEFGKGVPKDTAAAVKLYRLAAQKGHITAIAYMGVLQIRGVIVPKDFNSGKLLLLMLTEAGPRGRALAAKSLFGVGVNLITGEDGVKENIQQGLECLTLAAQLGCADAVSVLSQLQKRI
jgi:TPR repeat protein